MWCLAERSWLTHPMMLRTRTVWADGIGPHVSHRARSAKGQIAKIRSSWEIVVEFRTCGRAMRHVLDRPECGQRRLLICCGFKLHWFHLSVVVCAPTGRVPVVSAVKARTFKKYPDTA